MVTNQAADRLTQIKSDPFAPQNQSCFDFSSSAMASHNNAVSLALCAIRLGYIVEEHTGKHYLPIFLAQMPESI